MNEDVVFNLCFIVLRFSFYFHCKLCIRQLWLLEDDDDDTFLQKLFLDLITSFYVGFFVQVFSLYAALAIFFNFFLQITCFLAIFILDVRREEVVLFQLSWKSLLTSWFATFVSLTFSVHLQSLPWLFVTSKCWWQLSFYSTYHAIHYHFHFYEYLWIFRMAGQKCVAAVG